MSPRIPSASRRRAATTYRPSIFLSAASLIAVALLAVACGGQTPGGTTTPSASASPTSSAAPSVPASPGASAPTDTPEPSVDAHGVPTLEALLPTTVGNVALEVRSLTGGDFYALGTDQTRDQLDTMLGKLDKAVTDLTVADAYDPTGRTILEVGVFRVAGAKPDQLLSEWVASTQAAKPGKVTVSNATIDGRAVTKLVDLSADVGGTTYAFAKGDTLFLVGAADPVLASDALGQLPKS